ncbi:MAG: CDP-2,3-bis-(O-geranylgeranyl)-sn-glycerol synthase [Methanoregulaceae archaeon]|jgi:CDP-2,3-bis-(O-geranylgeranyl)-sn-glycerol synthase
MLPAYIPNPIAALFGGGVPIDLGKRYPNGTRILGDGKTYRGFIIGVGTGVAVGLLQIHLTNIFHWTFLPVHTILSIVGLALGALLGDICKSYFKRRLGKQRGERWPIADQYDLVAGAIFLMVLIDPRWLISNVNLPIFLFILIITPILHRVVNIIGYYIGVKDVPW